MDWNNCTDMVRHSSVVVSESGRSFRIENNRRLPVNKLQIDGCLIDDHRQRCDWGFEICDPPEVVYYVELKGADLGKAFAQLCATMRYLGKRHRHLKRRCFIVASRVPRSGPQVQNLQVKMVKEFKALLSVETVQTRVRLEDGCR